MALENYITSGVCTSGVWEDTWIWYCDECQVHGSESHPASAHDMALYHSDRITHIYDGDKEEGERLMDEDDMDEWYKKAVSLSSMSEEDRLFFRCQEDSEPTCDLYVISEKNNKALSVDFISSGEEAFSRGDYGDFNLEPIDIEKADKIRKQLGLP
jgi:hypothetical protein